MRRLRDAANGNISSPIAMLMLRAAVRRGNLPSLGAARYVWCIHIINKSTEQLSAQLRSRRWLPLLLLLLLLVLRLLPRLPLR